MKLAFAALDVNVDDPRPGRRVGGSDERGAGDHQVDVEGEAGRGEEAGGSDRPRPTRDEAPVGDIEMKAVDPSIDQPLEGEMKIGPLEIEGRGIDAPA